MHTSKNKTHPITPKSKTILLKQDEGKTKERQFAEFGLSPTALNAITAHSFSSYMGEADLTETIGVMREKAGKVNKNDLSELEATLTAQSVTLDAMFNKLANIAILNMAKQNVVEGYLRLALKAQSQCSRTIEVIAAMKNPPVVFAKQANISHGNQQVNNGGNQTNSPTHTEKTINQPNELLEVNNGSEKMDSGATQTTIPKDNAMATVAT